MVNCTCIRIKVSVVELRTATQRNLTGQPQDRSCVCVIAHQYSSDVFVSLFFQSRKDKVDFFVKIKQPFYFYGVFFLFRKSERLEIE